MKAHIIKPLSEYTDDWLYACYLGCSKLGIEVVNHKTIEDLIWKAPKGDLVFAHIDETTAYLKSISVTIPAPLNIPDELMVYTKRNIGISTLGELMSIPEKFTFPLFIKPKDNLKTIPAGVINNPSNVSFVLSDVAHLTNEVIMTSNKIEMLSEYRCFIHDGKLRGIQHYLGDFTLFPDIKLVEEMIKAYTKAPFAYTLDVAVTDKNETVFIECNDAWSIGNYGFDAKKYVMMLRDRWRDILKYNSK